MVCNGVGQAPERDYAPFAAVSIAIIDEMVWHGFDTVLEIDMSSESTPTTPEFTESAKHVEMRYSWDH